MDINNIEEITIEGARQLYNGSHIGNDLLLIDDINKVPLPNEPQRMKCILLGICLHGKAQYSVDTEENCHSCSFSAVPIPFSVSRKTR